MASSQQIASSTRSVGWGAARKVARRKVKKKRPPCFFKRVIFRIVSQLTEILEEATKHEGGWKNSRQFAQLSRTPIVFRSSYVNTKKVWARNWYQLAYYLAVEIKKTPKKNEFSITSKDTVFFSKWEVVFHTIEIKQQRQRRKNQTRHLPSRKEAVWIPQWKSTVT